MQLHKAMADMAVKTYSTDTKCPSCAADVYDALYDRITSEGGSVFQWECFCGALLEIEVEVLPSFTIRRSAQQPLVADGKESKKRGC